MLEVSEPERTLYLTVPVETDETFFQRRFAQAAIQRYQLKLLIYDPMMEEILEWTT